MVQIIYALLFICKREMVHNIYIFLNNALKTKVNVSEVTILIPKVFLSCCSICALRNEHACIYCVAGTDEVPWSESSILILTTSLSQALLEAPRRRQKVNSPCPVAHPQHLAITCALSISFSNRGSWRTEVSS